MSNELIQKAAEALDIALGRTGVFNPPELDFMCAAYDGLVAALQPSPPQDVEEWIERNELVVAAGSEVNSVIKTSALRAFLAGKVLVPVIELNDVLEMAGLALSMTPLDSRERKSFRAVADAIK